MTDDRPQILIELGSELERAAARKLSTSRAGHARPRRGNAVSLTAIAAAGALVFTLAVTGHPRVSGPPQSIPSGTLALDSAFVVLRRPAKVNDRLPSSELRFLREHSHAFLMFSLDTARARRVVATAGATVWLVPGPREACLVGFVGRPIADGGQGASFPVGCSAAHTAESYGMIGTFGELVAGVLPNGSSKVTAVARDGHTTKLQLTAGAFAFHYRRQDLPLNVDYTDPAGARQRFDLPSPAPVSRR